LRNIKTDCVGLNLRGDEISSQQARRFV